MDSEESSFVKLPPEEGLQDDGSENPEQLREKIDWCKELHRILEQDCANLQMAKEAAEQRTKELKKEEELHKVLEQQLTLHRDEERAHQMLSSLPEKKVIFKGLTVNKESMNKLMLTPQIRYPLLGGSALITFEEEKVAQRILKVKNHVLAIGRTQYPLEVTLHTAELNPDEIFIHVCMTVDYGKLPTGKTLLTDLHESYSNAQFSFDSKTMHCTVQGPFTELQTFSRDLLGSLNLRSQGIDEILLPSSSSGAKELGKHDHQQVLDSTESAQETAQLPNWDQVHEAAAKAPLPQSPVGGEAVELLGKLEDFSLAMDLDIYLYMQRFCAAEYQGVLHQHHVDVVDVSGDDIVVLYLQPAGGLAGAIGALQQARLALQQLYQQLDLSLCKEKIAKEGLGVDSQALRALMCELQKLYPQLLCHEDLKQLYLVGNLVDVSQAKQFLQDSVTRRDAAHTVDTLSSSQPSGTTEAAQHLAKVPVDTSATRLRLSRPELKGEFKLAANFSTLKADRSQAGQGLLLNQDSPLMGQVQLSGKHSSEIDAPGLSNLRPLTQQYRPPTPMTDKVLGSAAEPQQNPTERKHVEGGARLTGQKVLLPFAGKENSTFQHLEDSKGSGPIGHHPHTGISSICDVTWTSSALGSKRSASTPVLQRSNSFSLPRAKESSNSGDCSSRLSEEMSLDSLQWFYLKDVCHGTIDELCRAGGVHILERHAGNCTMLTLQAADRRRLLQAKWKMEDLVRKCPDLVCRSVSYSELAVSGPDDSALSELCSLLRGKSFQVGLSKDKYKLCFACPKEMLPGVTEAFHVFSSRTICAMKSLSMSPGPDSTGKSSFIQPSRSQDPAPPGSLNSLQHLNIGSKVDFTDVLRASWVPEAEEKRSPSPWRLQQAWGQEEARGHIDSGSGRGGSGFLNLVLGEKPSPPGLRESQEMRKTKLSLGEPDTTQLKQVLPDRFQFARDKSRGGHNEAMGQQHCPVPAADRAPLSLPTWLPRATAAEPPPAVVQQAPAAEPTDQGRAQGRSNEQEEPNLSSQQKRDPSSGQESSTIPLGQCDACQGSGMTCQGSCGHTLCRTCFAADSTQPACCRSSSDVPSCKISGTLKISSLSQSLPGYSQDPTLCLAYSIPDGVQGVGDPRPGQPYKGGNFCAFLPDNKEGLKTAKLLKKAFDCGLTFQIKSCDGEERVTWGLIPHKTSLDGGQARLKALDVSDPPRGSRTMSTPREEIGSKQKFLGNLKKWKTVAEVLHHIIPLGEIFRISSA
uniref:RING-type E3 ubiquitin transferase n=1 Tax=Ficedula albicollis TaxID=59894 RepID=A0A803WEA4_FICAL